MSVSASSPITNIAVTVMVALLVILLPFFDRLICKKLSLDLSPGAGTDGRERRLMRLRSLLLLFIFCCYTAAVAYIVFFSREASDEYRIHIDLMGSLANSIRIDSGFIGVIGTALSEGLSAGFNEIHIESFADIAQVYLNILLFIPMGYLLPYCFRWFREEPGYRPVLAGFAISFFIENLQLIFRRGFYDVDDLASNTIGALIGQLLYLAFAFRVTHPNWRQDIKDYRRFRHYARKHTLFPFAKKSTTSRITLLCSDENTAREFYALKLGFRPIRVIASEGDAPTGYLFEMGSMQLEVLCVGAKNVPAGQKLTFRVHNLDRARKQLLKHGVAVSDFSRDPYQDLRSITFPGPDGVTFYIVG